MVKQDGKILLARRAAADHQYWQERATRRRRVSRTAQRGMSRYLRNIFQ